MAEKFGKLFADLLTLSSIDGTTSNMVGFLRRFGRSPDSLTSGLPIKVERFFSIAAISFVFGFSKIILSKTNRCMSGSAGTLLFPRFFASTSYFSSAFGVSDNLSLVGHLGRYNLMN